VWLHRTQSTTKIVVDAIAACPIRSVVRTAADHETIRGKSLAGQQTRIWIVAHLLSDDVARSSKCGGFIHNVFTEKGLSKRLWIFCSVLH